MSICRLGLRPALRVSWELLRPKVEHHDSNVGMYAMDRPCTICDASFESTRRRRGDAADDTEGCGAQILEFRRDAADGLEQLRLLGHERHRGTGPGQCP